MLLNDWLDANDETNASFGRKIGVSKEAVRRYRQAGRTPVPIVMQKIIDVTRGEVTADDWFEVPPQRAPAEAAHG